MPEGGTRTSLTDQAKDQFQGATGIFSPGEPLVPSDPQPVRVFDFQVGSNSIITPRSYEPFSFPQLRAFSNVELVRLAIETRKSQFERQVWQVKPKDKKPKGDVVTRAVTVQTFWERPDGETDFGDWIKGSLDDLLSIDAPAWEIRRTRGGQFVGLDIVPGDTIKPLVDETGRRPRPPYAAYQQIIKGRVWNNLTTDNLIYSPRNLRPNHVYGFGPVEQIIVTINTILRRQTAQLAYFGDSNVPAGILNAPEGWTAENIRDFQAWMDARLSQPGERAKVLWVPAGAKYQSFKDAPLKDDFDEWLARIVAYAFDLPPTPFIKQMNRSTSENDKERADEEGLTPLKAWWKRRADFVIQVLMGHADLEWGWNEDAEVDATTQAEIDDKNLRNASTTIDEIRDRRGQEPLPDGLGAKPLVFTPQGAVLLSDIVNPPEPVAPPVAPDPNQPAPEPKPGDPKQPEPDPKPEKVAKRGRIAASMTRPLIRRKQAGLSRKLAKTLTKAGDDIAAQVLDALRAEKLGKAADDTGWVKQLDLSALDVIASDVQDDLAEVGADSGSLVLGGFGVDDADLVDQVSARAVDYASSRAAELVSLDGPESLISSTREMIRATITEGLEQNIGSDAIAENLQESFAFSAERASLIAETEVATANGQASLDAARDVASTGATVTKEWLLADDPCDECEENADGGPIGIEDDFPSGDDAAPAHPRCACDTAFSADDSTDDSGD